MNTKKCTKCNKTKSFNEFHKRPDGKIKIRSACNNCVRELTIKRDRTKKGVICKIYTHQKITSKRRKHPVPNYTKQELIDWCINQDIFHSIYDNWVASGFNKLFKPSCDRKDDYKGYSFNNMQLMTWKDNFNKSHSDRINGINNKVSKPVVAINKYNNAALHFISMSDAMRKTGISQGDISLCCNGKQKSAGGFTWEFIIN